ncbi:hypothetical protein [Caballeronia sp. LZ035]|nr:hypothetical protein [Caballeronia sp. LZ035]
MNDVIEAPATVAELAIDLNGRMSIYQPGQAGRIFPYRSFRGTPSIASV